MQTQIVLSSPPTDGISCLTFGDNDSLLLSSSWDGKARIYDVRSNLLRGTYKCSSALLDCAFVTEDTIITGGIDGEIRSISTTTENSSVIGKHQLGVKCLNFSKDLNIAISGSWDKTIACWDCRVGGKGVMAMPAVQDKVYCMDVKSSKVVVGLGNGKVNVFDLRMLAAPEQIRESPLKLQMRTIRILTDMRGFAIGGIEGRVGIEYFGSEEETGKKEYVFKCHRQTREGIDYIYPVNAIAFHPFYGTFATGGCDGIVNMWDYEHRKRLAQLPKCPTSISSVAFNRDGSLMAIASSYTWEQGDIIHPPDAIIVRIPGENEVKPRGWSGPIAPLPANSTLTSHSSQQSNSSQAASKECADALQPDSLF
ncbi:mitotic checkpoint protein BUB3 [Monocercomonoides exilis]|uniref:mitotic checkpoint protein BUB3 n=1 Tax=Monocercomonoides exilis TaxID=2049356 RepID=UPI0035595563|nr:mitotic checkpoint protein BUB3 [Monocercomonoides exilis]|eukprot:MONOS_12132.1-p1 / transcript=MONOS_12132.1 / gene=MONOS_12132 / organism=Monocercomonoides_exilis_PA203 / gene_product=mitotic checkpoint protein BUB3 / transcript_product=mitotic checkpoint protein BUB3 / location=Mono_scaffold00650:676-2270(-) / protein_length=367 / sequence_SO=supercontig / SO=protein_coding / is_pseudo=false